MTARRVLSRLFGFLRCKEATTAVEFALLAPLIIAVCMMIFEGGRIMWAKNTVQSATEQAARYAIVNSAATDNQITAIATGYYDGAGPGTPTFSVVRDTVGGTNFVAVNGSYSFTFMFNFFDFGDLTLTGKARVPIS